MAKSNNLGQASVEITADTAPLRAGLSDAKRQVQTFGNAAEREGRRVGGAFSDATRSVRGTVSGLTRLVGTASAVAAAVSSIVQAVALLNEAFKSSDQAAQNMLDRLSVESIDAAIKDRKQKLEELNSILDSKLGGGSDNALERIWKRAIIEAFEVVEGEVEEQIRKVENSLKSFRDAAAQLERIDRDSRFIRDFNAAIDRLEALQDRQRGNFGVNQPGNIDAVVELLQEIRNSGGRWRF